MTLTHVGSQGPLIRTSKDLTLDCAGVVVVVDPTTGPIIITLPLAATAHNQTVVVKNATSSIHQVAIVTAHGDVLAVKHPDGLVSNITCCANAKSWFYWSAWSDGRKWHLETCF